MFSNFLQSIATSPWVLALGTIAFFTVKGLLWILIPALALRYRNALRRTKQVTMDEAVQAVE